MEVTHLRLPCKEIKFPKQKAEDRTFVREFGEKLALAIKVEGQLQPIGVWQDPDSPKGYTGIFGKHRHHAIGSVLKSDDIDCYLYTGIDADDVEQIRISENLWRNSLNKAQQLRAIKRWHEYYSAKYPERLVPGAAGGAATRAKHSDPKPEPEQAAKPSKGKKPKPDAPPPAVEATDTVAVAPAEPARAEPPAPEPEAKTDTLVEMVVAATGVSERTAYRDIKLARAFTHDQLQVFEQLDVPPGDMAKVAAITDDKARDEVVNLVASGMSADDSIAEVVKDYPDAMAPKKPKKARAKKGEPTIDDLPDEEWFAKFCGEKAAMFGNTEKFRAAALLFRRISDRRHAYRTSIKKILDDHKAAGVFDPLYYMTTRHLSLAHPKDWLICDKCVGKGMVPFAIGEGVQPCPKCRGACFEIKTESYL